ncbi:MAG: type II toxin-antitoxin system PemK/MazF family toxin [Bacteroidetes bacterium]|nr:type II toxin-antitoxin system PemK/MazF family toxin [Bacteroidota bacterium]MCL5737489.1 type II toxin-antitoxin system PemK/MazF family toxin [Bacteroidota bacterium]
MLSKLLSSTKGVPKKSPVFVYLNKGEGGLSEDSLVHCGQIRAVDKAARLINKLGQLSKKRMDEIDNALMLSLGLN